MFIATNHPLKRSSLREERNCFELASAQSCCAPNGARDNSVTSGYKHLAPLGRSPCRAVSIKVRAASVNSRGA